MEEMTPPLPLYPPGVIPRELEITWRLAPYTRLKAGEVASISWHPEVADMLIRVEPVHGEARTLSLDAILKANIGFNHDRLSLDQIITRTMLRARSKVGISILESYPGIVEAYRRGANMARCDFIEGARITNPNAYPVGDHSNVEFLPRLYFTELSTWAPLNYGDPIGWSLGFYQEQPFAFAPWDDEDGIHTLVEMLMDRESCEINLALQNPTKALDFMKHQVHVEAFYLKRLKRSALRRARKASAQAVRNTK